jgi:hypothetical protein
MNREASFPGFHENVTLEPGNALPGAGDMSAGAKLGHRAPLERSSAAE